jgi:hypothetical protein
MIEKTMRTFSEKTTSVEHDIEKSQKGVIAFKHYRSKKFLVIPTSIEFPKLVNLTPLNLVGCRVLTNGFYGSNGNIEVRRATNADVSTALNYSATGARLEQDHVFLHGRNLYIAVTAITATSAYSASPSLITGSPALFKKVETIASNGKNYIVLVTRASTATPTGGKVAYEVRGY